MYVQLEYITQITYYAYYQQLQSIGFDTQRRKDIKHGTYIKEILLIVAFVIHSQYAHVIPCIAGAGIF